ncbi:MAG: glutamine-hydrolyzing carbamoyl-phosphate synthase small subunit [Candidatus Omnitrophica bacterium]|nr:glutamine-hydrolyzing carbamoyl-phosphate synthase small subunit [Candidatus Omnitrophota bacterium]
MTKRKAKIALEDGRVFNGFSCGATGEAYGEVIFNTSMSGYQEILTDPSYKGQLITMTYPLIGNYGVNKSDAESARPFTGGFIVRECCPVPSNWRSEQSLPEYLKNNGIVGIEGVDTRALTKHIRMQGAMRSVISTLDLDNDSLIAKVKASQGLEGKDLVKEVTCKEKYVWNKEGKYKVTVIDCGVKHNILKLLEKYDCRVTVVPAGTTALDILEKKPDGVMLSNGPGDPQAARTVYANVEKLLGKVPIFGICLGHQMIGLAIGGKTYKLKFGHHGGNQPVKDLTTGKILITVQNHGFCVDMDTLDAREIEATHINLNDNTLEGFRHKKLPVFSVQFHPEYGPGPRDSEYLFKQFTDMMEESNA